MSRTFTEYENENGGVVGVHRVTKETEGAVLTTDGTGRDVKEGDVLFSTPNPNVFTVGTEDSLKGYTERSEDSAEADSVPGADDETGDFNPSENNADAVRRYLEKARERGDRDEFNRVVAAEQADKNRATAVVEYDR